MFNNHHYIIYANAERNNKDVHSAPIEVFVDKNMKPLKLVLAKDGYGYKDKEALKRKPQQ